MKFPIMEGQKAAGKQEIFMLHETHSGDCNHIRFPLGLLTYCERTDSGGEALAGEFWKLVPSKF
ncbi:hypothetical protein [Flexibacterium corallicola]|uniref:hypothetical protein n=1 Tax=Flexibacterium corallicola TaxID=3037259 RepID=UPI00286EFA7A|nr:hypothetical protein [Pseudovibrio sp. M1P-2-3]